MEPLKTQGDLTGPGLGCYPGVGIEPKPSTIGEQYDAV